MRFVLINSNPVQMVKDLFLFASVVTADSKDANGRVVKGFPLTDGALKNSTFIVAPNTDMVKAALSQTTVFTQVNVTYAVGGAATFVFPATNTTITTTQKDLKDDNLFRDSLFAAYATMVSKGEAQGVSLKMARHVAIEKLNPTTQAWEAFTP